MNFQTDPLPKYQSACLAQSDRETLRELARLGRSARADRQRVNPARQFIGEQGVDHSMAFDPAFAIEGVADDLDPKMRFPLRVMMMAMSCVMMRFVDHGERPRRQRRRQFRLDPGANGRLRLLRHSTSPLNPQEN
jgi:hypothetical protein